MPAKFHVRLTRAAEQDIEEFRGYIADDNPAAAARFIAELERQVARLERFPEKCALIPENEMLGTRYRHLLYGQYRSIFRTAGRAVLVLRVIQVARLLDTALFDE